MLKGEILPMGIGFTITGAILFLSFFIQYGLCCRKKQDYEQERRDPNPYKMNDQSSSKQPQRNPYQETERAPMKNQNPYIQ